MKIKHPSVAVLVLFLAGSFAGCASNGAAPAGVQQLAVAEQSFRVVEDVLTEALTTGLLTPAEYRPYAPFISAARAALSTADADVAAGKPLAQAGLDVVSQALDRLQPVLASIGAKKASPKAAPAIRPAK